MFKGHRRKRGRRGIKWGQQNTINNRNLTRKAEQNNLFLHIEKTTHTKAPACQTPWFPDWTNKSQALCLKCPRVSFPFLSQVPKTSFSRKCKADIKYFSRWRKWTVRSHQEAWVLIHRQEEGGIKSRGLCTVTDPSRAFSVGVCRQILGSSWKTHGCRSPGTSFLWLYFGSWDSLWPIAALFSEVRQYLELL